ncbi:DUF6036 family nucleotidyltransferase [Sorangium sp. So ce131]|uniref:DUF6036 family nucleotidyltransferase n=1 Tax=Sorangium sp. So ce131 TaxID=3133282 RepID=UPI003F61D1D5
MNDDFLDLLSALSAADARFMVVGAYAVGVHGRPRATKDLDVWIEASPENATRVMDALRRFGAPLSELSELDLATPGVGFMMGVPPRRIDVLTQISGVEFAEAWPRRIEVAFGEHVRCPVIALEDLLANKRAADRLQDRADVEALERLLRLQRGTGPS